MESLQMIAKFCGITLDELLRAEEVIAVAEKENKENINRFTSYIDGIFNISAVICLLLPLYKVELNNMFYSVPLYQFKGWLAVFYWVLPIAMAICGIIQILINKGERDKLKKSISLIGIILNTFAIILLILSGQPYPAVMFFTILLIKGVIMLTKQR